jgi:hypothetical protein
MELQQQLNSVINELDSYKKAYENVNAEKIAIDQLLVENLKTNIMAKKDLLLANSRNEKDQNEINLLKSKVECLQQELEKALENKEVHVLIEGQKEEIAA